MIRWSPSDEAIIIYFKSCHQASNTTIVELLRVKKFDHRPLRPEQVKNKIKQICEREPRIGNSVLFDNSSSCWYPTAVRTFIQRCVPAFHLVRPLLLVDEQVVEAFRKHGDLQPMTNDKFLEELESILFREDFQFPNFQYANNTGHLQHPSKPVVHPGPFSAAITTSDIHHNELSPLNLDWTLLPPSAASESLSSCREAPRTQYSAAQSLLCTATTHPGIYIPERQPASDGPEHALQHSWLQEPEITDFQQAGACHIDGRSERSQHGLWDDCLAPSDFNQDSGGRPRTVGPGHHHLILKGRHLNKRTSMEQSLRAVKQEAISEQSGNIGSLEAKRRGCPNIDIPPPFELIDEQDPLNANSMKEVEQISCRKRKRGQAKADDKPGKEIALCDRVDLTGGERRLKSPKKIDSNIPVTVPKRRGRKRGTLNPRPKWTEPEPGTILDIDKNHRSGPNAVYRALLRSNARGHIKQGHSLVLAFNTHENWKEISRESRPAAKGPQNEVAAKRKARAKIDHQNLGGKERGRSRSASTYSTRTETLSRDDFALSSEESTSPEAGTISENATGRPSMSPVTYERDETFTELDSLGARLRELDSSSPPPFSRLSIPPISPLPSMQTWSPSPSRTPSPSPSTRTKTPTPTPNPRRRAPQAAKAPRFSQQTYLERSTPQPSIRHQSTPELIPPPAPRSQQRARFEPAISSVKASSVALQGRVENLEDEYDWCEDYCGWN